MFGWLFYTLRKYGVPVTTRELIDLNRAVSEGLVFADQEEFYQLAKTILVKDERFFDKFDRAMKDYFDGIEPLILMSYSNKFINYQKTGST
ncbi:VWA containing CoxE family protein [Acinetobacter baumannii]|nr:VWA containing CoxE family protein [Acinetobacter baumannii]